MDRDVSRLRPRSNQCLYYSSDQGSDQAIKVTSEQSQHSYVKEVPKATNVKDDIHKETWGYSEKWEFALASLPLNQWHCHMSISGCSIVYCACARIHNMQVRSMSPRQPYVLTRGWLSYWPSFLLLDHLTASQKDLTVWLSCIPAVDRLTANSIRRSA